MPFSISDHNVVDFGIVFNNIVFKEPNDRLRKFKWKQADEKVSNSNNT